VNIVKYFNSDDTGDPLRRRLTRKLESRRTKKAKKPPKAELEPIESEALGMKTPMVIEYMNSE